MRVIINADDLGCSSTVNDTIRALMDAGKISSATILANGPAFQEVASWVENFPSCSFGVHLNLTQFQSLTKSQVFYDVGIIDEAGIFQNNIRKIHPRIVLAKAIEKEWEEQIKLVLDYHISVSHLDSHHHVHTIPWLFPTLKRVQKKFGIRTVRATMNWYYRPEVSPSTLLLMRKKIWNWSLRHIYTSKTTDYFTSYIWFTLHLGEDERGAKDLVELMCHPGQPWASDEFDLLWSDRGELLSKKNEIISYHDL